MYIPDPCQNKSIKGAVGESALYNIKGGVGKTAACVNLAYSCALCGNKTLLWDLNVTQ